MTDPHTPSSTVYEVTGIERLGLKLLSAIVRVWQYTLRFEDNPDLEGIFRDNPEGSLLLIWHNRLFGGFAALRKIDMRGLKLHSLVSASKDGAKLSYFMQELGAVPVRGSSSRRGSAAALELLKVLKAGNHVSITVDGPRGPRYQAQPGAALLIKQTGVPVHMVGVECESCWVLNSWDRFIIPKPFSRVKVKIDRYAHSFRNEGKEERTAIQEIIQKRLMALTTDQHQKP